MKQTTGFICVLVIIGMFFALTSGPGTLANTVPLTRLPDIDFNKELSDAQYDALCTGFYTAEECNGMWYYKFTTRENYVYIPVSAFFNDFHNDYTDLNADLTKGAANTRESCSINYIYKGRSTSRVFLKAPTNATRSVAQKTVSSTYITKLNLISSLSGSEVMLQCTMNDHVLFQYSDQVTEMDARARSGSRYTYVTPSTADQYVRALTRTTGTVSNMVTPEFTLSVDKAGTDGVVLKQFFYKAVSSDSISNVKSDIENAAKFIDVVTAVGEVGASSSPAGAAASLYSLFKTTLSLVENTGGSFYETKTELLTQNEQLCLQSTFTSPFKLKSNGDFWEINISLSDSPSIIGTHTKLSVSFSASTS